MTDDSTRLYAARAIPRHTTQLPKLRMALFMAEASGSAMSSVRCSVLPATYLVTS